MKFRKKPVVIEAMQNAGGNGQDIIKWANDPSVTFEVRGKRNAHDVIIIKTLEGIMEGSQNDWIIKGVKGEFYPCKPDIFEATYEKIDEAVDAS